MNKVKMVGTGFLGFVTAIAAQTQDDIEFQTKRSLSEMERSRVRAVEVDPIIGNTCYGMPCGGPTVEDNCDNTVIEANLEKLRGLNIIDVSDLSPFACTGYCFSDNPEGHEADKCEKAEALAKLVKLAEPLKVPVKR